MAEPILRGELSCAEIPHETYALLLESLVREGDAERAARLHERGYALIRDNRDFVVAVAHHVHYLLDVGRRAEAKSLVERHMEWATDNRVLDRKLRFHAAAARLFAALDANDESEVAGSVEKASVLAQRYRESADSLAAEFDARNGNAHVSAQIAESMAR